MTPPLSDGRGGRADGWASERLLGSGGSVDDRGRPTMEETTKWTALLGSGIELGARNGKEYLVETTRVVLPAVADGGIDLLELAGGREDGRGITIVSGLVPGGCADRCSHDALLVPGDSISQATLVRRRRRAPGASSPGGAATETRPIDEEVLISSESTECLGYDGTVGVLRALMEAARKAQADFGGDGQGGRMRTRQAPPKVWILSIATFSRLSDCDVERACASRYSSRQSRKHLPKDLGGCWGWWVASFHRHCPPWRRRRRRC